jgi:hypothetical protein
MDASYAFTYTRCISQAGQCLRLYSVKWMTKKTLRKKVRVRRVKIKDRRDWRRIVREVKVNIGLQGQNG